MVRLFNIAHLRKNFRGVPDERRSFFAPGHGGRAVVLGYVSVCALGLDDDTALYSGLARQTRHVP
jgi:hypothetical protein